MARTCYGRAFYIVDPCGRKLNRARDVNRRSMCSHPVTSFSALPCVPTEESMIAQLHPFKLNHNRCFVIGLTLSVLLVIGCGDNRQQAQQEVVPPTRDSTTETTDAGAVTVADQFNPESSSRLLRIDELEKLTPFQLKVTRNEMFARHGFVFTDPEMVEYFSQQGWYQPDARFSESMLTVVERKNVELLTTLEQQVTAKPGGGNVVSTSAARQAVDKWARGVAIGEGSQVYGKSTFRVDFDSDGDLDAVGVCALGGGGTGYYQYIAAFDNRNGDLVFIASGDAGARAEWTVDKVVGGGKNRINCTTDVWAKDDPDCCPSAKGKITYSIAREMLIQE